MFAAIGLLASVIFGRSPVGLLLPAFGGLAVQLTSQVLPMPAPNPLWEFDGLIDLVAPASKG